MPVQNLGMGNFRNQNMQNLAEFRTISKYGGKYLRNEWRYWKSDMYIIDRHSFRVRRNKSGELWYTNFGDLMVESYLSKSTFLENHITTPRGCNTPKFLHALENDKSC